MSTSLRWLVFLILLTAVAFGGYRYWTYLQTWEETDDAQVDADLYPINSRIAGSVKAVYVHDNETVKAGQLLVELDPTDYTLALEQARASVRESRSQVEAVRPNISITETSTESSIAGIQADIAGARAQVAAAQRERDSILAQIRQAQSDVAKTSSDLARYRQLLAKDEISRQQAEQAEAAAQSATAVIDARRASAEAAARNIDAAEARLRQAEMRETEATRNRPRQVQLQNALVASREATTQHGQTLLQQAEQTLTYTKIFAPIDGIVGRSSVVVGQQVAPGQQLMVDVPIRDLWITANFKETQLRRMRPKQRATIHVDAYGQDFEGYVESVAAASGARFSILPPENATGNYVKVVQRVPVRIRLKEGQDPDHRLRPGMSAEPRVWLDKVQ